MDDDVEQEVLANAPHNWSVGLLQLPLDSVVEHVHQDNCRVSDRDVTVALELDEQLLDEEEGLLVVGDLSYEEGSLDLLEYRLLLHVTLLGKLFNILVVVLLGERELLDVHQHLLYGLGEAANPLQERDSSTLGSSLKVEALTDITVGLPREIYTK